MRISEQCKFIPTLFHYTPTIFDFVLNTNSSQNKPNNGWWALCLNDIHVINLFTVNWFFATRVIRQIKLQQNYDEDEDDPWPERIAYMNSDDNNAFEILIIYCVSY